MLNRVSETLEKYKMIHRGNKILVGVSGGPDSIALLHVLTRLSESYELSLHVVHLNHMFRGQAAEEDAKYVERICEELNVPSSIKTFDVPTYIEKTGLSPEDAARRIRYKVYEEVARMVGADKIALGHNADDQAETVIMRILRGTGLKGLGGIPPVRDGRIIRPLIETTREEIEAYCLNNNLHTRLDATNVKSIYFRNKVRLELLPLLETEYSPAVKKHLCVLSDIVRCEEEYLNKKAEESFLRLFSKDGKALSLSLNEFSELPMAMQRRVIKKGVEEFLAPGGSPSYDHVQEIIKMAVSGSTGSSIHLSDGVRVHKSYDRLFFEKFSNAFDGEVILKVPGNTVVPELGLTICSRFLNREEIDEASLIHDPRDPYAFLDLKGIEGPVVVRTRRNGDVFHPLGMEGKKKLKDFFIDQKIPRHIRSEIPLLASEDRILWVLGSRISEMVRVTENTEEVALLEFYNVVI